MGKFNT